MNKAEILGRNLHPHQVRIISPLPPAIPFPEPAPIMEVPECCTVFDDRLHEVLAPARGRFFKAPFEGQFSLFEGDL